tara:strand:- start:2022 stop:2408 length:387 start_codon:yes stop_codon:yes gene_type:complete
MILKRISLNLRIFSHCLEILYFYRFKEFNECIKIIQLKRKKYFSNLSPHYLLKKINLFSSLLMHNNCFYKSMCLFTLLNNCEKVELIIGIKKSKEDKVLSHSWIEYKGHPLEEEKLINEFQPLLKMKK